MLHDLIDGLSVCGQEVLCFASITEGCLILFSVPQGYSNRCALGRLELLGVPMSGVWEPLV